MWDTLEAAWEEMFAALTAYKQAHGDCNPPRFWKDERDLRTWCYIQRKSYKKDKLSPDRTKRLEKLGFVWDRFATAWEEMFAELVAYKQTNGGCNVPQGWKDNPKLGQWCIRQRINNKKNKLSPDQIMRLEQLGFVWDRFAAAWEEMFAELTAYKQVHGDCNVPQTNPKLASWCANQRTRYKKNKLIADQIERLERLGFRWFPYADDWEEMFAALTIYKQVHGDCNVPHRWKENPELGVWCQTQRFTYKKTKLPTDRIKRLEQLGFSWGRQDAVWDETWEKMFAALTAYKQRHGDCNVPHRWENHPRLAHWCERQRKYYKNNRLSADHANRLEQLGFLWNPFQVSWEEMYAALSAYKQTHGDCNVPDRWKENPQLAHWCANQRQFYKKGRLFLDRIARLEQLGFLWDRQVFDKRWEEKFAALTAYKRTHGDCNVPAVKNDKRSLGHWLQSQRSLYRRGKLSPDRIRRLEQLGILWDPLEVAWEEMFAVLTAYKQAHGDCNVPQRCEHYPKLANWCAHQRSAYRNKKLSPDRIKRLEHLGSRFGVRELKKK